MFRRNLGTFEIREDQKKEDIRKVFFLIQDISQGKVDEKYRVNLKKVNLIK
ncbi:MAG: hypothetical protein NTZ10_06915 [Candidatus Saganbacteria bacterium]|nr:hypothetical protein [Candidatus Saganbacteria bacterium]